ncbi:helix-turn-helix transcriptional regulator [Cellulosimicrobium cellulans]|uniref:helix-turn-helix transcriptional regulator n=1 Tax=Cellulosimicrobium cellulans TaxID=1710 RepID=UPI000848C4FD|nr:helix-turn-helix transcriptional regulator [Cellulosimicrobium cellulans]
MPHPGPLGDLTFAALLRQWRDRLAPAEAGIVPGRTRRAPGLRREELAQLAGISVDYVLRLEQGRATTPSAQVVTALARGLRLTRAERDLLFESAGLLPPRDGTVQTHVPASVQRLTTRLDDVPVGVFGADWTMVWWNAMWEALHGDPSVLPPAERNVARAVFGSGVARSALHPSTSAGEPGAFEAAVVADLKRAVARYPTDPRLRALVDDLSSASTLFAALWTASTPAAHVTDRKMIEHPVVGDLELDCDVLDVPGADLHLVAYTAAPGSDAAGKLDLLRVTGVQQLFPAP